MMTLDATAGRLVFVRDITTGTVEAGRIRHADAYGRMTVDMGRDVSWTVSASNVFARLACEPVAWTVA